MKNLTDYIFEAKPTDLGLSNKDAEIIIDKLQDAFCEEMNAWYQYYIITPFLVGNERTNIANDYKENAEEELKHAGMLLNRINELGGTYLAIDSPEQWNVLATHKYIKPAGPNVEQSLEQIADAERSAIETYTALEVMTRDNDVVTNQLVKEILADEQKHLQEMIEFLTDIK